MKLRRGLHMIVNYYPIVKLCSRGLWPMATPPVDKIRYIDTISGCAHLVCQHVMTRHINSSFALAYDAIPYGLARRDPTARPSPCQTCRLQLLSGECGQSRAHLAAYDCHYKSTTRMVVLISWKFVFDYTTYALEGSDTTRFRRSICLSGGRP